MNELKFCKNNDGFGCVEAVAAIVYKVCARITNLLIMWVWSGARIVNITI